MSKIEISKAIHNKIIINFASDKVVVSVSKIEISKAIHNAWQINQSNDDVVVSVSKIEITQIVTIKRSRSRASTSYSTGIIYCIPSEMRWVCGMTAPNASAF